MEYVASLTTFYAITIVTYDLIYQKKDAFSHISLFYLRSELISAVPSLQYPQSYQ